MGEDAGFEQLGIKVTEERVTQAALGETSLKCYPSGSVVVAMYGGFNQIGRTGLLAFPPPSIRHSRQYDHTRVDCAPSICKAYLISELTIGSLLRAVAVKTRTSRAGISGTFPSHFPMLEEQETIAGVLRDADVLVESLGRLIGKKRSLKLGVTQSLLTGKKRLPGFSGQWITRQLGEVMAHCSSGATPFRVVLSTTKVP